VAAFTIERIDPSKLNDSGVFVPVYTGNAVPAARPRIAEEPQHEPQKERRIQLDQAVRPGVPLFEIFALLVTYALVLSLIFSYVRLNEISNDTAELRSQLLSLKEEEKNLRNRFHASYDLKEVENQAINDFGMTTPDSSQIVYLNLPREDKAEVLYNDNFIKTLFHSIARAFTIALEYFK
jgi:hypothetical protein